MSGFQHSPEMIDQAAALARLLQNRAADLQTPAERRQQAELDRMLQQPTDKVTLVQLTDQAFRCQTAGRIAEHLTHILDVQGVPRFFSPLDRALLRGFQTFGGWLPGVAVPLVKEHMQHETANVVLPAETEHLRQHLAARFREGVRMNLNFLGEALLGEEEATRRLEKYLEALQLPEIEVLSVKISTIYSQISALARAHTLRVLCDRLELLYREAAHLRYTRPDGTQVQKFIYLDMEEYRDLHLTAQAFMRTLDRPGLQTVGAGIALQACIPDSALVQREINAWARRRVAEGGAPVTIRLVKGANMEMERVEASLRDWPQAPFKTKRETDANYKRMLNEALQPENLAAVRVGVASHNLFDLGYGVVLAAAAGAGDRVQFEMLEGMANHQRRALLEQTRNLLLYAPACHKEEFLNAIGYLIRRLDENTGPENFLRHAFKLKVGTPEWEQLERGFRESFALEVSDAPRRMQNRLSERIDTPRPEMKWSEFHNEPDTDWSLPQNSAWAEQLVARQESPTMEIPLVIAGGELGLDGSGRIQESDSARLAISNCQLPIANGQFPTGQCLDPSRPGVMLARYRIATDAEIDHAVACAKADPDHWRSQSVDSRNAILGRVAQEIRRARGDLTWTALANGGKILSESDPEVSEAVDFVEFYRAAARYFFELPGLKVCGCGVVVVVPPWNFPIAIPCGGMAAALAAGNTVILKPASDTVLVAWELCQCFWRAGVPKTALQFTPCPGRGAGTRLVAHPDVDAVILTGGTETALRLLKARPTMRLFAETGGKNAIIVTALSDRELAIKHIVHSAFSHGGQKCSATSLLLLEAEVYENPQFKRTLCDAVKSLEVGSAWDLQTRVGPLIRPPSGELEGALKTLEPGESWAVQPRQLGDNPNLWSPGVKYGVRPGSGTHQTEFFGPVLGVMRFEQLDEAVDLVNQTGYGLTSGLHSLDEREHAQWKAGVRAGNLYINRGTTGAEVLRQPFGGMGKSSFGPGLKAGGPNYVAQFMQFAETPPTVEPTKVEWSDDGVEPTVPPTPSGGDVFSGVRPSSGTETLETFGGLEGAAALERADVAAAEDGRTPLHRYSGREGARRPGERAFEGYRKHPEPNRPPSSIHLGTLRQTLLAWSHEGQPSPIPEDEVRASLPRLLRAFDSYEHWWRDEFAVEHDHFRLLGQDNFRRYLPFREIRIRVAPEDCAFDIFARVCAARITGARVIVSTAKGGVPTSVALLDELTNSWAAAIEFIEESDDQLAAAVRNFAPHATERVRYAAPNRVPASIRTAAIESGTYIADEPVLAEGRVELLWYLREQSVCHDYHRYGNMVARSGERRTEPA